MIPSYLEITTVMGCPVACLKYCPQELILKHYVGNKKMDLQAFRFFIQDVPEETAICFAGVSEPFMNQQCVSMIEHASNREHPIRIHSTLTGLTMEDAIRLSEIPISQFVLHLPDACGNAHIPITPMYKEVLSTILTKIPNIEFMNMGGKFRTNRNEEMARDRSKIQRKRGRVLCDLLRSSGYQVLPNGDVYFCCMTRTLSDKVGSLYIDTYPELIKGYKKKSEQMQRDPDSICHVCNNAVPYLGYRIIEEKERMFGERRLLKFLEPRET